MMLITTLQSSCHHHLMRKWWGHWSREIIYLPQIAHDLDTVPVESQVMEAHFKYSAFIKGESTTSRKRYFLKVFRNTTPSKLTKGLRTPFLLLLFHTKFGWFINLLSLVWSQWSERTWYLAMLGKTAWIKPTSVKVFEEGTGGKLEKG